MSHPLSDEVKKFHEAVANGEEPLGGPRPMQADVGPMEADVEIEVHGSIVLFRPVSAAGRAHLAEFAPPGEGYPYFGTALAVGHRHLEGITLAMLGEGLILRRGDMVLIAMEQGG